MLQTVPSPGINARLQNKVKKDVVIEITDDAQMKQHHKLKLLKPENFPQLATTAYSKHVTSSAVSHQILSTSKPQGICRDDNTLDEQELVGDPCLHMQMKSMQKNVGAFDAASSAALQLPVTRSFLPSVVPMYIKGATKKEQFRKMRDYHNNFIKHPSYVHKHALTGCDVVKYLEHRLQEV